jgi:DNA polymerase-3 subunit epsilon
MKLIGLDFETANGKSGSICSVGLACVEAGGVAETRHWLVKPHTSMTWMSPFCTEVHGLTWQDVKDAPEFHQIWPAMRDFILQGDCVVIHNAVFDLRHLRAALALYTLPGIQFPYVCSLRVSRKTLPQIGSHALDAVAKHLGFTFKHHDALEDAIACARIIAHVGVPEGAHNMFLFPEVNL